MNNGAEQHSLSTSLILHLLPGVLATLLFVLLAEPVQAAGYPALTALLLAIVLVIVPFELGVLLFLARQRNGRLSLDGVVLYRSRSVCAADCGSRLWSS